MEPIRSRSAQFVLVPIVFNQMCVGFLRGANFLTLHDCSVYLVYSVAIYLVHVNNDVSNVCHLVYWVFMVWPLMAFMVGNVNLKVAFVSQCFILFLFCFSPTLYAACACLCSTHPAWSWSQTIRLPTTSSLRSHLLFSCCSVCL